MFKRMFTFPLVLIPIFILVISLFLVASAVSVGIKSHNITNISAERCTENTILITVNSSNRPLITGIPNSCFNKTFVLTFGKGPVTQSFTGNFTNSTWTAATALTNPSTVTSVLLTVSSWPLDYTWTPPVGSPFTFTYTWSQTVPKQFCSTVTVTTTSNGSINWSNTFNVNSYPYNGATSGYNLTHGFNITGPVNNIMTITGNGSNAKVNANQPVTYTLCHYGTPNPPLPPSGSNITFSYTSTTPSPSYYVCKTVTVTSSNAQPFYVGWYVDVDLQDLSTNYIPGGGHAIIQTGDYNMTLVSGYVYRISGIGWITSGIKDGEPKVFSVCWG